MDVGHPLTSRSKDSSPQYSILPSSPLAVPLVLHKPRHVRSSTIYIDELSQFITQNSSIQHNKEEEIFQNGVLVINSKISSLLKLMEEFDDDGDRSSSTSTTSGLCHSSGISTSSAHKPHITKSRLLCTIIYIYIYIYS